MLLSISMVFAIGALNRIADMVADEGLRLNRYAGYAVGALYGFLISYVVCRFPVLVELGMAMMLSVIVTGKIDHPVHHIGVASFLLSIAILGLPSLNPALLVAFVIGGVIDEAGSDLSDKGRLKGIAGAFFRYRLTMEALTLAVSAYTGNAMYFVVMLAYDAGFTFIFTESLRRKLLIAFGQ